MNQKIQHLQELLTKPQSDHERVQTLCALAYALRNNDTKRALTILAEARAITLRGAGNARYREGSVETDFTQGVCETCAANFDEALTLLFRALQHAQDEEFRLLEARILRWIGISYVRISMHTTALEYLSKSRSISEGLGDTFHEAQCWNNIGDVYFGLRDFKAALGYYRESLRGLESHNDPEQQGIVLYSIASAYTQMKEYRRALLYHQQSLAIRRELNDVTGIGTSMAGMSDVYAEQGQFDKALEMLFQVSDMALEGENRMGMGWSNWSIGALYLRCGKSGKAIEYLRRALEIVGELRLSNVALEVHKSLSECYKQTGEIEQAFFHFEQYHAMREDIALQDNKQAIRYLQRGFEMDKARQDAEIYRLRNVELARLNQQNEQLLLNVLPSAIAARLKNGETTIADKFNDVTVLFADIAGFTALSAAIKPEEIVALLDNIFSDFDAIANTYGLEKIKTIGDCYMLVGGLPEPSGDHAVRVAQAALQLQKTIKRLSETLNIGLEIRIGIHTGAVVAGVIGKRKFTYDLWGDTVNTASRMESHSEPGKIHVTTEVYQRLSFASEGQSLVIGHSSLVGRAPNDHFVFEERGEIDVKGKGLMRTWFLTGALPQSSV